MRRLGVPSLSVLSLAAILYAAGAPPASAALPGGATRYATVRHVCAAPPPARASCLALALVPSRPGASGASLAQAGAGSASAGPAGGLTPADLAGAYGFVPAFGGGGQTLAIVDAFDDPKLEEDLAAFDAQYGLPACTAGNGCLEKVGQTGSASELPSADTRGWSVEITLDVESAHSVCPNCKILLVEANSETFADLAAAVNEAVALGADEVSNSYGGFETEFGASEIAAYDHPGTVVTAASGDSGYLNWDFVFELGAAPGLPDAPAALPSVVSVGGTSLKLKASGARKSETVWNGTGRPSREELKQLAGSGGGCSTRFAAPTWQHEAAGFAAAGCGSARLDNDVAADGDPFTGFDIYDTYKYEPSFAGGWLTVGGTSLSSPVIAGLFALAGGSHGASYPAATLYAHLGQPSLYDVTAGGNGFCDGEAPGPCGEPELNELLGPLDCLGTTACDAAPGLDGPAGVGTPNGLVALGGASQAIPTVHTTAASSIQETGAVLNATVDPNGNEVLACSFEYGLTTAYGQSVPCSSLPGSGTSPVAVSATLAGLTPKTAYHFRIAATSSGGTSVGKGKKLKTS